MVIPTDPPEVTEIKKGKKPGRKPKTHTISFANLLDASEVQNLLEEIEQWRDGMQGTNLEHSEKYQQLEECADQLSSGADQLEQALETLDECLQHELFKPLLSEIHTLVAPKKYPSRAARLDNALGDIRFAVEVITDHAEKVFAVPEGATEGYWDSPANAEKKELKENIEAALDEVESALGELEGVEFPGMY